MQTCLVVVAALCAFAAVATSAAPQPQMSGDAEKIWNFLSGVVSEMEQLSAEFESEAQNAEKAAEEQIRNFTNGFNHTTEEWVQKAHNAGVDVTSCIDTQLADLQVDLNEVRMMSKRLSNIDESITSLKAMDLAFRDLLNQTKNKVEECQQQHDYDACAEENVTPLLTKEFFLSVQYTYLRFKIGSPSDIVDKAVSVTEISWESKKAHIASIFTESEACIKKKLGV